MNFELLDRPYFVRRIVFVWMVVLFTYSIWWFFHYAETSTRPGIEVAAIIGSINAPLCFLMGAVMNFWKDVQTSALTPPP